MPVTPDQSTGDAPLPDTDADALDRVLVAVEDDTDARVVDAALDLAGTHDARIDALSVVPMNASVHHWDMVVERREDGAERALDAAASAAADADVALDPHLTYGDPAEQITAYADRTDADLVVLGDPDHTRLRRLLTPKSVTARVQDDTTTPVLAVPATDYGAIDATASASADTSA